MSYYEDDDEADLWWRRNRRRQMDGGGDPELGLVEYGSIPVYDDPHWRYEDNDDGGDIRWRRDRQPTDDSIEEVQRRERERVYYGDEEELVMPRRRREEHDDSDFPRRRNRQDTDDSAEDIRRRERERVYYGDEEEIEMPRRRTSRRRHEESSDSDIPRRRRRSPQRRDDSIGDARRYNGKDELNTRKDLGAGIRRPRKDEDEFSRRRRAPSIPRRRSDRYRPTYYDDNPYRATYDDGYDELDDFRSPPRPRVYRSRSRRDRYGEDEYYYRRQRSPSISRRRRSDRHGAITYGDDYESDDFRPPSPPTVRSRFQRARSSSPLDYYSPPLRRYRSGYRNVSPLYAPSLASGGNENITIERTFDRSRSRSVSSSEGDEIESDFPKKGKTSIPARDASRKAIIELSYDFEEEVRITLPSLTFIS